MWLALYQLLLHPETRRKYEFTNYRKTQILKVCFMISYFLFEKFTVIFYLIVRFFNYSVIFFSFFKPPLLWWVIDFGIIPHLNYGFSLIVPPQKRVQFSLVLIFVTSVLCLFYLMLTYFSFVFKMLKMFLLLSNKKTRLVGDVGGGKK